MGVPPKQRAPWHRTLCNVIHPILALAAEPEEQAAARLFTDEHPWVASDALVQRRPASARNTIGSTGPSSGCVPHGAAHAALVERVSVEELRRLWNLVVDVAARRC